MGKRIKQFGKKLFLLAGVMVSAAMLGACSSDNLSVQPAGQDVQGQQGAVGFDAYLSRATSRNGAEGELTPNTTAAGKVSLEGKGFGVFAYYTDNDDYDGNTIPNFMWNQQVVKDATAGWTYSPVKYWPNEFSSAEAEEADRVSFFAYAPYVEADVASGKTAAATDPDTGEPTEAEGTGITAFSRNNATGDPLVKYIVNLNPAKAVDLCWGVQGEETTANSGILEWTKANKTGDANEKQEFKKEYPWLNVQRPKIDSKVKFQFEHALSQLNIQVKNDVDVASPAGESDPITNVKSQTKVWIRSITLTGFTTKGALNLNNTAVNEDGKAKANWANYNNCGELATGEEYTIYDGRKDGKEGTAAAGNEKIIGINDALVQSGLYADITAPVASADLKIKDHNEITGVTGKFQNLFNSTSKDAPIYVIPTGDAVKVTIAYDVETYDPNLSTYLSDGKTHGSSISNVITKEIKIDNGAKDMILENGKKYTIKLHLGLNSVKFDADVSDWTSGDNAEAGLPGNGEVATTGVALSEATVGMFVGADGLAYASADDAETAGTTAEAYIAYKSATAGESLAFALTDDASGGTSWNAFNTSHGWTNAPTRAAIDGGTWRWPTKTDFDNMCAVFKTLPTTGNGVTPDGTSYYWSTEEYDTYRAWVLGFSGNFSSVYYRNKDLSLNLRVRAVFAF